MECSDIKDSELYQHEESELEENKIKIFSENCDNDQVKVQKSSGSTLENILNLCKRHACVLSSSEDENESIQNHQNYIATYKMRWEKKSIKDGSTAGRLSIHNILKEISSHTGYEKKRDQVAYFYY